MAYLLRGVEVLLPKNDRLSRSARAPPRRYRRTLQKTRNPVHRSAEQNVGEKRQNEGHDQRLQRIEPSKDSHLIDQVHDDGEDEDSGNRFEALPQTTSPIRRVAEERIEVRGTASPRVFKTVTNREDQRRRRLEHKPERHRPAYPANQIAP